MKKTIDQPVFHIGGGGVLKIIHNLCKQLNLRKMYYFKNNIKNKRYLLGEIYTALMTADELVRITVGFLHNTH